MTKTTATRIQPSLAFLGSSTAILYSDDGDGDSPNHARFHLDQFTYEWWMFLYYAPTEEEDDPGNDQPSHRTTTRWILQQRSPFLQVGITRENEFLIHWENQTFLSKPLWNVHHRWVHFAGRNCIYFMTIFNSI